MKLCRIVVLLACLGLCFAPNVSAAGRMGVGFLNPGAEGDAFFGMMTAFMQAAADDLGIDLEVIYCDRDHIKMREEGMRLLGRAELPEYLILINEKNAAVDLLILAADKGVKVALINEGLQAPDKKAYGDPGVVLENWILEYLPDDRQAGYMLSRALIAEARRQGMVDERGMVNVVGIAGSYQTGSSTSRVKGLQQSVGEDPGAAIRQIVPAHWEEEQARDVTRRLMVRYPETGVIWAASDLMARGALDAIAQSDEGRDLVVGSIDWAPFALDMVVRGELTATVGGHFVDGGWALVMLHDYHHGLPLPKKQQLSEFSLVTRSNVQDYLNHFSGHDWSVIDFTRFSRHGNPSLTAYRFGLEPVLEQIHSR